MAQVGARDSFGMALQAVTFRQGRAEIRNMNNLSDSLDSIVERLKLVAPEVLDLATANTEAQFVECFDRLLERGIAHLEANSKNFKDLDEVGLSAVLAGFFNGMPGIQVVQEANSNGHVDITITVSIAHPVQRRLAEAKIERGPAYHESGLQQLMNRYATGRGSSAWLLAFYVKVADIKSRMEAIRKHLDSSRPCNQDGQCVDHKIKWAFVSTHKHSSGEQVGVAHVGCNLFSAS